MKSFFLILLLLYLSFFPNASPVPLVEITEEITIVVNSVEPLPDVALLSEDLFFTAFPDIHSLTPQHFPHPELRPPDLFLS